MVEAGPFLKWAGGKTQLLSEILPRFPERVRTYYEPFIGGGAVFFAMARARRFERAVISDGNPALVEAYRVVRDEVDGLLEALAEHQVHARDEDYYYEVRAQETDALTPVARAARLIFMNKTCFNGLYRVNRSGRFNVPFGRYKNPKVRNEPLLRACSEALQSVDILCADFREIAKLARSGDGIYFDPPYVPLSSTSSFCNYAKSPFGPKEHTDLADAYAACCRRGAHSVLSNSDCPETRAIYKDLEVQSVLATRAINSVASKRGAISELLVTGLRAKRSARSSAARRSPARIRAAG